MAVLLIHEIYDQHQERRVLLFQRDNGTFCYEEEYFSRDEYEMCWILKNQPLVGFYDSQKTALKEAIANVDWLREE